MKIANKKDILSCVLKKELVKIPGFNMNIYIQEMNITQREDYLQVIKSVLEDKKLKKNIGVNILLPSIIDKDGNQIFTKEEAEKLANINPRVITALTTRLLEISGLFPESLSAEKNVLRIFQNIDLFSNWLKNLARRYMK